MAVGLFKCSLVREHPHSKGPKPKTWIITVYALSGLLKINQPAAQVTREFLPEAMKTKFSIGPRCLSPTKDTTNVL